MNEESKIEILFEDILNHLKTIQKEIRSKEVDRQAVDSESVKASVDRFLEAINTLKVTLSMPDLSRLEESISQLQSHKKETRHYFLFFPDLREWILAMNKVKSLIILSTSLILLLCSSVYFYLKNAYNKPDAYKYRYLKYNSNAPMKEKIGLIDYYWKNDSLRKILITRVDDSEREFRTKEDLYNRKVELDRRLKEFEEGH